MPMLRLPGRLLVGAVCRVLLLPLAVTEFTTPGNAETQLLRVGHFPNITHMQALVAHNLSRKNVGWFEQRLGPSVKIEWYIYNAGPSAMEALFANSLDLTYVGPSPALNAFVKSAGDEVRIVAGAANGGAALVVQPELAGKPAAAFKGKRIATPQFGNTQDVSARAWLVGGGLKITQTGGDAQVVPTANPDQLSLFQQKQIDAVWTVEPWVTHLEMEAGGTVLVEESDAVTTVLVSRAKFLVDQRELVRKFVAAHKELTEWIKSNAAEAQRMARDELEAETRSAVSVDLVARALERIVLQTDISKATLETFVAKAQSVGFLRGAPDLSRLVEAP
jgi:NitT/TauT family transport system substrate-binding protein